MNIRDDFDATDVGIVVCTLLGVFAWGVGLALWATADEAADPAKHYAATIALAVVGAAFSIAAIVGAVSRR